MAGIMIKAEAGDSGSASSCTQPAHDVMKTEGQAEAKANALKRRLIRCFGALPGWAERRIGTASMAQLDL